METAGMVLLIAGLIISLIGGIQFLVIAFQEHLLWGLGFLFFPLIGMIFVALHWQKSHRPFLVYLGGMIIAITGSLLSGRFEAHMRFMGL